MTNTVTHFRDTYLPITETFIYQYISNLSRYNATVCGIRAENVEKFPYECRDIFFELPKRSLRFWWYGISAKAGLRNLYDSYYRYVIRERKPELLHAHFGQTGINLIDHRTEKRPLITSFYGMDASKIIKQRPDIVDSYRELFTTGDLFLVEGPSMKQKLLNLGCPEDRIEIQRIAIDAEGVSPRYPNPDSGITVLMVGRFVEKKGFPDGIRAFARSFADSPDAELRIVGGASGEYEQRDLEEVAEQCEVRSQTTFTGFLDYQAYIEEVQACDILLAPSKTAESGDSEGGAPTVLLEAQAAGKPVVSTTHADIPFIINDGETGILAEPGDVNQLSSSLIRLSHDSDRLLEMGQAGRKTILEDHDIQKLSSKLEKRYDKLLD